MYQDMHIVQKVRNQLVCKTIGGDLTKTYYDVGMRCDYVDFDIRLDYTADKLQVLKNSLSTEETTIEFSKEK